jgi:4'-phosphopantetheinyl transferase
MVVLLDAGARWLARGEDALPAGLDWLAPDERRRAEAMRYAKRRTEYLLRRLVAKHTVAALTGRPPAGPAVLAAIEVRNAPSGAPYLVVDGAPTGLAVSITDRAGWAVCLAGAGLGDAGCDLELVEPRTGGFVRDFCTVAERRYIAAQPPGEARDVAANLIWSAKESALKVLRTGLRRDTRSVEVSIGRPGGDGWGGLDVRTGEGGRLPGWWRRDGRFLFTVAGRTPAPPPAALEDPLVLAAAVPRHSWRARPLPP